MWQHTRGSALLGWVKDDAAYIAERIGASTSTPVGSASHITALATDA